MTPADIQSLLLRECDLIDQTLQRDIERIEEAKRQLIAWRPKRDKAPAPVDFADLGLRIQQHVQALSQLRNLLERFNENK